MTTTESAKVLIVDDTPANLLVLLHILADEYAVSVADSGARALALLAQGARPDLILLDVVMPDMDGYAVCAALKADPATRDIPVIFITAKIDEESEAQGLNTGGVDFIRKPVTGAVIRARVRLHLELRRRTPAHEWSANMADQPDGSYDRLTGVYSRSFLEKQIVVECGRARRSGSILSLLLIAIDDFDAYTERFGHAVADEALRLVAKVLGSKLQRPGDLIARYRGEAFACLLPATDFEPARELAEGIEQAVRTRGLGHGTCADAPSLRVSVGIATRRRPLDGDSSDLLRLAEEQLERAKQQGRLQISGKVLVATPSPYPSTAMR